MHAYGDGVVGNRKHRKMAEQMLLQNAASAKTSTKTVPKTVPKTSSKVNIVSSKLSTKSVSLY